MPAALAVRGCSERALRRSSAADARAATPFPEGHFRWGATGPAGVTEEKPAGSENRQVFGGSLPALRAAQMRPPALPAGRDPPKDAARSGSEARRAGCDSGCDREPSSQSHAGAAKSGRSGLRLGNTHDAGCGAPGLRPGAPPPPARRGGPSGARARPHPVRRRRHAVADAALGEDVDGPGVVVAKLAAQAPEGAHQLGSTCLRRQTRRASLGRRRSRRRRRRGRARTGGRVRWR